MHDEGRICSGAPALRPILMDFPRASALGGRREVLPNVWEVYQDDLSNAGDYLSDHGRASGCFSTAPMPPEFISDFRNTSSLARLVFPKSIGKWRLSSEVHTGTFKKCR